MEKLDITNANMEATDFVDTKQVRTVWPTAGLSIISSSTRLRCLDGCDSFVTICIKPSQNPTFTLFQKVFEFVILKEKKNKYRKSNSCAFKYHLLI